ncbi:14935_t:CDS:2, partial [Gigaspora margarita]
SDLDLSTKKNYNLKTGITKKFSNLDVDEYNETWFNEDSDSNTSDITENQDLQEVALFTKKLRANEIIHSALPIKYPAISKDRVVTIFNDGWDNYMDAFNNYSINGHGIKYCEFSDLTYLNTIHNNVDVDSDFYRKMITDQEINSKKIKTYIILCSGFAKLEKIVNYLTNTSSYFIEYTKYKQNDKWHHFIKININEIDLSLLKKLFAGELNEEKDQAIYGQITRENIVEK